MGLIASLFVPKARSQSDRDRLKLITLRASEALRLSPPTRSMRTRTNEDDSLELGPYNWLHKLRRAALVAAANQPVRFSRRLKPEAEERDPLVRASMRNWQHAELSEHVLRRLPSTDASHTAILDATAHLIQHEDHTGFYLPIDFSQPLWVRDPSPDPEHEFTSVGSSAALARELGAVCTTLQIPANMSIHDEQLLQALDEPLARGLPWQLNPEAAFVALRLRYLAIRSVKTGLAIAFE